MLPVSGDLIGGKYRIVRLIGDGGMGSVYEARHEGLRTQVALKFLHEDLAGRPGLSERFLQEARVAATIQSPHVARVTDVDVGPNGQPYLVMELLSGESLQHRLDRDKKLPPATAVDFALQIASGLEAAHAIGVVHRDLKPDNVFVTPGTGGPLLKLIDFGIAKLYEGQRGLTRAGVVMGTAEYMPPEQLYAASDVDGRADVYALGVIVFEMLSGRLPAEGEDAQVIVGKVLAGDVLSLAALEPGVPQGVVELVRRAMAPDRNARIASAHELRTHLANFAGELSPAGILAAREAPLAPVAAAAPKTLPPEAQEAFAKGATEAAPALARALAGAAAGMTPALPPAVLPHSPQAVRAAARTPRRSRAGWLIAFFSLLALGAAGAGGYVLWSESNPTLPPPPLEQAVTPPPPAAFTAEGEASAFVPPAVAPTSEPGPSHVNHPTTPTAATPTATPPVEPAPQRDGGLFPLPLTVPSAFPPITIPSGLPAALPPVLPSVMPTVFPNLIPGLPAPAAPGGAATATPGTAPTVIRGTPKDGGKKR